MYKKGFTLIELIVVIAILAILAAIAVPRFATIQTNAENKTMKATAVTILNAAEVRYQDDTAWRPTASATVSITTDLVGANFLRTGTYTAYTLTHVSNGEFSVTYTDKSSVAQTVN